MDADLKLTLGYYASSVVSIIIFMLTHSFNWTMLFMSLATVYLLYNYIKKNY